MIARGVKLSQSRVNFETGRISIAASKVQALLHLPTCPKAKEGIEANDAVEGNTG